MERLSSPLADMRPHYDAVVVGSGYGGGIAACRLARAGRRVCVLERGSELHPGEYPDTLTRAVRQSQARIGPNHVGPHSALFDFHLGEDISVLVGCGLGGTSLINANVALEADPRVFDDERWPVPLRGGTDALLQQGYRDARTMLGSTPYPDDSPSLGKLDALARSASALGRTVVRPPLNVTFADGVNAAGVTQAACTGCGNCVTGCNDGSKNTVLMNYLPDAHRHGAQVFTDAEVLTVEARDGGGWRVSFHARARGREVFRAPTQFVSANVVVLAAGALGSTGILLRSARAGLSTSRQLGHRFSGNGDVIGFAYDSDGEVNGLGVASRSRAHATTPGPCITGMIDLRDADAVDDGLVIEDAVLPGLLGPALASTLALSDMTEGEGRHRLRDGIEGVRDALTAPDSGTLGRTQTYLVMSSDDDHGRLRLDGDNVTVHWPHVGERPVFRHDNDELRAAAEAVNGVYVRNPMWTTPMGRSLITVHPLGGCVMADDASDGVVDHRGEVFSGVTGAATHPGLYVADGAVVPRPLGVNPLLTISALAERACSLMITERGWDAGAPTAPEHAPPAAPTTPGLRFTERMHGFFSTKVQPSAGTEAGYRQGRADGSPIEFVVTVDADDVDALVRDPATPVRLSGTVLAPALGTGRLTIVDGAFTLFEPDLDQVETSLMRYRMPLVAEDGSRFLLEGHKTLHHSSALRAWQATTTLGVTAYDEHHHALGTGMLHIAPTDLLRQLTTMRIPRSGGARRTARMLGRFGSRFTRQLLTSYGGVLAESEEFAEVAAPHAGRDVRLPEPESTWCHRLPDGTGAEWRDSPGPDAFLRLTRYGGGTKGPVLLVSGFGMSTAAFVTDTIHTNLTEYLVTHGYDVWLFDVRWDPDLPSSGRPFDIDDVARVDWPTGVDEVRRRTGAESVQVVAHCFGSMSFLMAVLAGMTGVRSAVCSQVTTHPVMTPFNKARTQLRTGKILQGIGVRTIRPDAERTLPDEALDVVLRLVPVPKEERCGSAVCRWINAFYGPTHHHAQLNQATHADLGRLFGVADINALNHISTIVRKGTAVDRDGRDTYLPHVDRLRLPILFLAGDHNRIFLPSTSARTLQWLRDANGPDLYERVVLENYSHLDGFIGRDAVRDVYPVILRHLDAHAAPASTPDPTQHPTPAGR